MRFLLLGAVLFLSVASAGAGGFHAGDQSSRAMGLGGAFVAMAHDASSLHANPSAISFLQGTQLSVGATIMIPENSLTLASSPDVAHKMQSQVLFPPNFSLTHVLEGGIGLGVGVSMPFVVKNEWSSDWAGGRAATRSEARVLFVSPTVSVRLMPSLSLGMSLNAAFTRLQLTRRIGFDQSLQPDGIQSIEGSGKTSYGFQTGMYFHPNETWSLAITYRSSIVIPLDGATVTFSNIADTERRNFPDGLVSTTIETPDHIAAGVGCRPLDWLYLGGDIQYTYWSTMSELALRYDEQELRANARIQKSIPLQWGNTFAARGGVEITVGGVGLRAGISHEQSPVPDAHMQPWFPDAARTGFSGGVGYPVSSDLQLDFACSFVQFKKRSVTHSMVEIAPGAFLNGTYASSLTMICINMSYSWE